MGGKWLKELFGCSQDYSDDSDSSDDDENGKRDKYFRKEIDGTTARFKLSKEDWARIPINTFPSGGRLLSGDWTRIFLSKVKESNPWCSLRFKNNHVRSENSRKIHSAVFFRGGAECKRPMQREGAICDPKRKRKTRGGDIRRKCLSQQSARWW